MTLCCLLAPTLLVTMFPKVRQVLLEEVVKHDPSDLGLVWNCDPTRFL